MALCVTDPRQTDDSISLVLVVGSGWYPFGNGKLK